MMAMVIGMRQIRIMREESRMLRRQRQLRIKQHTRIDSRPMGAREKTKRWPKGRPPGARIHPWLVEVGKEVRGWMDWGPDAYVRGRVFAGRVRGTWSILWG